MTGCHVANFLTSVFIQLSRALAERSCTGDLLWEGNTECLLPEMKAKTSWQRRSFTIIWRSNSRLILLWLNTWGWTSQCWSKCCSIAVVLLDERAVRWTLAGVRFFTHWIHFIFNTTHFTLQPPVALHLICSSLWIYKSSPFQLQSLLWRQDCLD